jgi:SAM-dependent methyltransferase
MRNEDQPPAQTSGDVAEVPCDERVYFESFYKANVRGRPEDRMTIVIVAEPEARFHYNALENSLLRAFARVQPVARGATVEAWRMFQQRAELRHLDIGSGTGHWVDFFRAVYLVASSTAVEVVPHMAEHLRGKYAGSPVSVVEANVAEPEFAALDLGGDFDLISAIGVMFHIVDDARWARAVHQLAARLKPGAMRAEMPRKYWRNLPEAQLIAPLIAQCLLFLVCIFLWTMLACFAFEAAYRPVGRWSHSQVIEKFEHYRSLRNEIGARHGMGIRPAQLDSIFKDSSSTGD